jgi:hypothetical protein
MLKFVSNRGKIENISAQKVINLDEVFIWQGFLGERIHTIISLAKL